MADALAASLDAAGRPPRFGDGDDGRGVLLDAPATSAGRRGARCRPGAVSARRRGGPRTAAACSAHVAAPAARRHADRARSAAAARFAGAGMTLLRAGEGERDLAALRCRAARLSVHRRARPRRRAVGRAALRRRRDPRRSRNLLLSRRAGVARLFQGHARPQHADAGRLDQARMRRPVPVADHRPRSRARSAEPAPASLAGQPRRLSPAADPGDAPPPGRRSTACARRCGSRTGSRPPRPHQASCSPSISARRSRSRCEGGGARLRWRGGRPICCCRRPGLAVHRGETTRRSAGIRAGFGAQDPGQHAGRHAARSRPASGS